MYENPFSTGLSDAPDPGTALAALADGAILCSGCLYDPTLPLLDYVDYGEAAHNLPAEDEQWAVIGFDPVGTYGDTTCAHCNGPT